jgi:hypothetical protein
MPGIVKRVEKRRESLLRSEEVAIAACLAMPHRTGSKQLWAAAAGGATGALLAERRAAKRAVDQVGMASVFAPTAMVVAVTDLRLAVFRQDRAGRPIEHLASVEAGQLLAASYRGSGLVAELTVWFGDGSVASVDVQRNTGGASVANAINALIANRPG